MNAAPPAGESSPPDRTDADPRCGRCGYNVRGSPSGTCPECGADLAAVGTFTGPWRPTPVRQVARVAAWTALVALAAFLFNHFQSRLPLPRQSHVQRVIFLQGDNADRGLSGVIMATASGSRVGPAAAGGTGVAAITEVTLHWQGSDANTDLHVDWRTRGFWYASHGQTTDGSSGFGPAILGRWMDAQATAQGTDLSRLDAAVAASQAANADTAVGQMSNGTGGGFLQFTSAVPGMMHGIAHPAFGQVGPPPLFLAAVGWSALILWLVGCRYLWRRPIG